MIATLDASLDETQQSSLELPDGFEDMAHICKMLADPSRLRIVFFLLNQPELNVGDICSRLEQSQPAVSHHIALLKRAGVLQVRRDGKHNFYSLSRDRFQTVVLQLFDTIAETSFGGPQIDDVVRAWAPRAPEEAAV